MRLREVLLVVVLQLALAFAAIGVIAVVLSLVGCGATTRTVERERFQVDGTAGGLPVQGTISRERTQTEETTVNTPDLGQSIGVLGGLASAVTPVGIGGGIIGLAAAWFFRQKARTATDKANWADDAFIKLHSALQAAKADLPEDAADKVDRAVNETMDRDEKQHIARAKALS